MNMDFVVIDFPCPNCARYISKSIGEIRARHSINCDCGQTIHVDEEELQVAIKVISKTLKDRQNEDVASSNLAVQNVFMPDEIERIFDQRVFRKPS